MLAQERCNSFSGRDAGAPSDLTIGSASNGLENDRRSSVGWSRCDVRRWVHGREYHGGDWDNPWWLWGTSCHCQNRATALNPEALAVLLAGAAAGWVTAGGNKGQPIRLVDVLALGPLMIYAGMREGLPSEARRALVFAGAATITYNGRNYLVKARSA